MVSAPPVGGLVGVGGAGVFVAAGGVVGAGGVGGGAGGVGGRAGGGVGGGVGGRRRRARGLVAVAAASRDGEHAEDDDYQSDDKGTQKYSRFHALPSAAKTVTKERYAATSGGGFAHASDERATRANRD